MIRAIVSDVGSTICKHAGVVDHVKFTLKIMHFYMMQLGYTRSKHFGASNLHYAIRSENAFYIFIMHRWCTYVSSH